MQNSLKKSEVNGSTPNDKILAKELKKISKSGAKPGTPLSILQIKKILSVVFKGATGRDFKRKLDATGLEILLKNTFNHVHVYNKDLVKALKGFKHASFEGNYVRMNLKEYNSFMRVISRG